RAGRTADIPAVRRRFPGGAPLPGRDLSAGRARGLAMITQLFSLALWLAGIGHFCILGASVQVPARLGWKTDLARLTPFNRKLMWTYGAFTVLTIVAFGSLTLALRGEFLRGNPARSEERRVGKQDNVW